MLKKLFLLIIAITVVFSLGAHSQQMEFMVKLNSGTPVFQGDITTIPFQLFGHKIFIKIQIEDSKVLDFIFDTGAITAIHERVAEELNIAKGIEIPSMKSVDKAYLSKDTLSFHFGDFQVEGFIPVISILPESKYGEPAIDGFIGSDIMRFFCVSIDYQNRVLTLSKRAIDFGDLSHRVNMVRQFPMGFPVIETKIDDKPVKFILDTGSPFTLVCPDGMIESAGIFSDVKYVRSKGWFMKWPSVSSETNYLIQAKEMSLGNLKILDVPVFLAELPMQAKTGLLGYALFCNYITTIDYPNNEVLFWPIDSPFYLSRYFTGLSIHEQGHKYIIKGVWENSPADKAGIRVGDEIIQLNEHDITRSSIMAVESILGNDEIKDIRIVIKRQEADQVFLLIKESLSEMLQTVE